MIRIVRPKYEVELFVGQFNGYGYKFDYKKSKSIGVFKTADEAEDCKKEYLAKNSHNGKYAVKVIRHSALELQFQYCTPPNHTTQKGHQWKTTPTKPTKNA